MSSSKICSCTLALAFGMFATGTRETGHTLKAVSPGTAPSVKYFMRLRVCPCRAAAWNVKTKWWSGVRCQAPREYTCARSSALFTTIVPILGPMCLFPSAFNDLHAASRVSFFGLSFEVPGTMHATMSSLSASGCRSVRKARYVSL